MTIALTTALLFGGSRDDWASFAVGVAVGLAFVLIFKRVRRKESR